jgi:hypothetical protein
MQQFNDSGFGLATHYYNALVGKTLLYEIGRSRAHKNNASLWAHPEDAVDGKHVAIDREVHCPDAIYIAVVGGKEIAEVLFVLLIKNKVLIVYLSKFFGFYYTDYGELIYVRCKVNHSGTSCRSLGWTLSVKNWWY